MIKYRICLSTTERETLQGMVSKGKHKATTIQKANVLLASDEAVERRSETELSAADHLSVKSVERIRRQFCERGMAFLRHSPAKPAAIKRLTAA